MKGCSYLWAEGVFTTSAHTLSSSEYLLSGLEPWLVSDAAIWCGSSASVFIVLSCLSTAPPILSWSFLWKLPCWIYTLAHSGQNCFNHIYWPLYEGKSESSKKTCCTFKSCLKYCLSGLSFIFIPLSVVLRFIWWWRFIKIVEAFPCNIFDETIS